MIVLTSYINQPKVSELTVRFISDAIRGGKFDLRKAAGFVFCSEVLCWNLCFPCGNAYAVLVM